MTKLVRWADASGNPASLRTFDRSRGCTPYPSRHASKKQHPEWVRPLMAEKRDTQTGQKRLNHLCYSNEELFERRTVKWRAGASSMFMTFESVSIIAAGRLHRDLPVSTLRGQTDRRNGRRGKLSITSGIRQPRREGSRQDRNPDKKIVCCAYGATTIAPTNIDSSNERQVHQSSAGVRRKHLPAQREPIDQAAGGLVAGRIAPIPGFRKLPLQPDRDVICRIRRADHRQEH